MKSFSLAALALIFAAPFAAHAEHPAYLHALSDLRAARAHLERPGHEAFKFDEFKAIEKIDAAINEIKHAAIDDGKDIHDHPVIDVGLDYRGRLHRSLELLRKARGDIEKGEDDRFGNGLRGRAFHHIDEAIHLIKEAIHEE